MDKDHVVFHNSPLKMRELVDKKVQVTMKDGRKFEGTVYTQDPVSEILIIHNDYENSETLYEILECTTDASTETIKENYQRLAMLYHPDKCSDGNNTERFVAIDKAWKVLRDPQSRKTYDAQLMSVTSVQQPLLFGTVTKEDMDERGDDLLYACKCGGEYIMSKSELLITNDSDCDLRLFVECTDCSLSICVVHGIG
ncbi:DPH4 homolog [Nilaparvata lugens]|uniref:DPH4 homolog n=1 Tax=Nilaparvata lugens TaxID=108931 RepID=UPI00193D98ED|nr:DPH4 homolog [Nilaparvata lugens]